MVSMVITTFNEGENIGGLLDDLQTQTFRPRELFVVDGGSTDDTVGIIESRRDDLANAGVSLRLEVHDGVNIAAGRNIAIAAAAFESICVADAGCRLEPTWCERITAPLRDGSADFVGGFFLPVTHNRFQRVLAALTTGRRPPRGFMPSSRSIAYTRTAWRNAGRYPEWLPWGEDTLFNERCIEAGARYVVAGDAIVHWEVRRTWKQAYRQFYRYAWGDGRRRRPSRSHVLNTGLLAASLVGAIAAHPAWLALFPAYCAALTARTARRLESNDWVVALGLALVTRFARACGYVAGLAASMRKGGRPS